MTNIHNEDDTMNLFFGYFIPEKRFQIGIETLVRFKNGYFDGRVMGDERLEIYLSRDRAKMFAKKLLDFIERHKDE